MLFIFHFTFTPSSFITLLFGDHNGYSMDLQVDVTGLIEGHSSYLWATRQILEQLELETYYPVFRSSSGEQ